MTDNLLFRNGRCWRQCVVQGALLMSGVAPCALVAGQVHVSSARTAAEAGLVDVHALAPDIALDMRYASSNNFTGRVVPGYDAPRCYLLRPAADALARVAQTLKAEGYRLQVFDCYRPVRSVKAFVTWAADLQDQATKPQYYPRVDKRALLGDYIAPTSGHSRGATLDLGLLECRPAGRVPCSGHGHRIRFLRCVGAHRGARHQLSTTRAPPAPAAGDGGRRIYQLSDGMVAFHVSSRTHARDGLRCSGGLTAVRQHALRR